MKTIYKVYRDRLVEITGKSRSLYSRNSSTKQSYNLGKLFATNQDEAEAFRDFFWQGNHTHYKMLSPSQMDAFIKSIDADKPTPSQKQKYIDAEQRKFVQLMREIDEIQKDTGKYELFIGYPFVDGIINGNITVKAPLLLFPAKISEDRGIEIRILKDEPVQLNKVFLLAYLREMQIKSTDILMEFENFAERFPTIESVNQYLLEHDIKLNFPSSKKTITDIEKTIETIDGIDIKPHCVIGRFPLANSIYYDYNELFRKRLSSPPIEALLCNKLPKIKEKKGDENYFSTHSLDFAQGTAVEKCDRQKHMVIYGPPGTGKSQTIAGVIVDNICKMKRSLVVSQKRSAIDVVFNRLGPLNSKAILLPDPEKNKLEFYAKVNARYEQINNYVPQFDEAAYEKFCSVLESEVSELRTISDSLFTVTPFGLTLQQMYSMSSNIARSSDDGEIYKALQKSDIIKMNYPELSDTMSAIKERNKAKLFYDFVMLAGRNPLVNFIKTDLDVHTLNQVKTFLKKLIDKDHIPFNISGYTYSRYLLVYSLERHQSKSIKPLVDMIARTENPKLLSALRLTYLPPLWPCFPFIKHKYAKKCRTIKNKLLTAQNAVRHFVNEFALLESVLESEGLAMVIDSIAYGNDSFLKNLLTALDEYISVRAMRLAVKTITETEKTVISFAFDNSKSETEFFAVLEKILPIRIYHEVVEVERKKEQILSKTIIYEDLRKRIVELKNKEKEFALRLAQDSFNKEIKELFEKDPEKAKNFLHQITKQRGQWPIRRLVEHFEEFLLTMFPCWLLSPESVSSVLPLKEGLFDVVLFDEASQLFIESTVPAVYRGKSLVVSGDNKQLRPTSVFVKRYMGDDSYDAESSLNTQAVMEVESLLDLASSRLNATHLTYHYRSRHEELINFSNYAFYGGKLQIAPNIAKNLDYLPIERIKVNGKWINRRNHEEAAKVVEIVKHIFKTRKNDETIGIVTFNSDQEEYIKDLLDKESVDSPQFRKDYLKELSRVEKGEDQSLFVKNLENVQGDERDIIIFSIAYARNQEGRLSTQFGTLSLSGGENRLNVAITRAIRKVYVVTSIEPEEFTNISTSKNDGPKLLVKYLQYARAVSERRDSDIKSILASLATNQRQPAELNGEFENNLKTEIEKMGYKVDVNLGNADYKISLAVYDESIDRYVLGIECDYTAYNSSSSMMERDVYRISFLNSRGWDIMRVWSRDWWLGKSGLLKQIENRITMNKKAFIEKEGLSVISKRDSLDKAMAELAPSKKTLADEIAATETTNQEQETPALKPAEKSAKKAEKPPAKAEKPASKTEKPAAKSSEKPASKTEKAAEKPASKTEKSAEKPATKTTTRPAAKTEKPAQTSKPSTTKTPTKKK